MDLTPGEKAVLRQIRVLYYNDAKRDHQVKTLLMLWPPTQHGTYKSAFTGLVAKELIRETGSQLFSITDSGLQAMGIAARRADPSTSVSRVRGALARLRLGRTRS